MEYSKRWKTIGDPIGEGGQGKVFKALDISKYNIDSHPDIAKKIVNTFNSMQPNNKRYEAAYKDFRNLILQIIALENPNNYTALKILHKPVDARDSKLAEERIKREIEALQKTEHPNISKIIDSDKNGKWFVTEYCPNGSLDKNKANFTGDVHKALVAFRPLVEGVATLHKKNIIHRDIKPKNILSDKNNNLVLADFGLVFFIDEQRTRISLTLDNVGSRDWMPLWAMGKKIEDLKPTFDVYALGKILWAMISKSNVLNAHYFEDEDYPEYNLELMFPDAPYIKLVNPLLKLCVVEKEKDCLQKASYLLKRIDKTLDLIKEEETNEFATKLYQKVDRASKEETFTSDMEIDCKVCTNGKYKLIADRRRHNDVLSFGLEPRSIRSFNIFRCDNCGNVQLFDFPGKKIPPAWPNEDPNNKKSQFREGN